MSLARPTQQHQPLHSAAIVLITAFALLSVTSYAMGNICGKESKSSDPFSQPGRTVGSAPTPQTAPRAAVPKISGQGQTLGGQSSKEPDDARRAAARAAEVSSRDVPYVHQLMRQRSDMRKQAKQKESWRGILRSKRSKQGQIPCKT